MTLCKYESRMDVEVGKILNRPPIGGRPISTLNNHSNQRRGRNELAKGEQTEKGDPNDRKDQY